MLKITNPISKRRFTFKEKLQRKATLLLVPLINIVPTSSRVKNKRNNLLKFYQNHSEESIYKKKYINSKPDNVEVELVSINIGELLPVEEIKAFKSGMFHIYRDFERDFSRPSNDYDNVMRFCEEMEGNLHSRSWSNLGGVKVPEGNKLHKYVKNIKFSASKISTSSIVLVFNLTPSDTFLNSLDELMNKEIKEETIFTTPLKKIFKSAQAINYTKSQVKQRMMEDYLIEMKWHALSEINKYFKLYFFNTDIMPPNIEIYKTNQIYNDLSRKGGVKVNEFWESIGMEKNGINTEISNSGLFLLHSESNSYKSLDNKIKIVGNSNQKIPSGYTDYNSFFNYSFQELSLEALNVSVINTYAQYVSNQLASYQRMIYLVTKKRKLKYKKIIKIRHTLHQNIQILKRFKNEISNEDFERQKKDLKAYFEGFEIATSHPSGLKDFSWANKITYSTPFLINETHKHSENLKELLDDTVQLVEIGTNRSLRNWSFGLSMLTVFLTIMTTIIATTSIVLTFLQLEEDAQNSIISFLASIIE